MPIKYGANGLHDGTDETKELAFDVTGVTTGTTETITVDANGVNLNGKLTATGITLPDGAVTSTAAELNYVDVATTGTAEASKALVLDASKNATGVHELTTDNTLLAALNDNTSITGTAVDYFVYRLSDDTDGGNAMRNARHTSWWAEVGAPPEVIVGVVTAGDVYLYDGTDPDLPLWIQFQSGAGVATKMVGYFDNLSCGAMKNGVLLTGTSTAGGGLSYIDFLSDSAIRYRDSGAGSYALNGDISDRNNTLTTSSYSASIVEDTVNHCAITTLPNAPIDNYGRAVPTIAVATDGGVSVIKDDGTVVDITCSNAIYTYSHRVRFLRDGAVMLSLGESNQKTQDSVYVFNAIPPADTAITVDTKTGSGVDADAFYSVQAVNSNVDIILLGSSDTDRTLDYFSYNSFGNDYGLTLLNENTTTPAEGSVAYITSKYNTGWMNGDIKAAFSLDTDTGASVTGSELVTNGGFATDLTGWTTVGTPTVTAGEAVLASANDSIRQSITTVVGETYVFAIDVVDGSNDNSIRVGSTEYGTQYHLTTDITTAGVIAATFVATTTTTYIYVEQAAGATDSLTVDDVTCRLAVPDRSVNGNGIGINGTITTSAVATGADLIAMSGFSAANYLEQPYNSDLDFGTGDFSIEMWVKCSNNTTTQCLYCRGYHDNGSWSGSLVSMFIAGSGVMMLDITDDSYVTYDRVQTTVAVDDNVWHHIVAIRNGNSHSLYIDGVHNKTDSMTSALASLDNSNATLMFGRNQNDASPDSADVTTVLLPRITATALSAAEVKRHYESEKVLFQDNAKCTLKADAVTDLSYDEHEDVLHVATASGRSELSGLRVVSDNTTNTSLVEASGGLLIAKDA